MALKHLLPAGLRDRWRPAYQRLQKLQSGVRRVVADSPLWPKPAEWRTLKAQIEPMKDARGLYQVAAKEFGILQVEREIAPFLDFVRASRPRVVGEIGLKHGGNTFLFLRMFEEATQFIAVDLVLQNVGKARYMARPGQRLDAVEGSSYSPAVVEKVRRLLGGRQFDFLFIDGDHSYAGVAADFVEYYPLVRAGGLMALHDIVPDEVARTGQLSQGSKCYGGGVHELWRRLKAKLDHREFVNDWGQTGFGIGVVTKPDDLPLDPLWRSELLAPPTGTTAR